MANAAAVIDPIDVNEEFPFDDMGARVRGEDNPGRKTCKNHVINFLAFEKSAFKSIESLPKAEITTAFLGRFSTYLKLHANGINANICICECVLYSPSQYRGHMYWYI
jgi:hypothetical protein